MFPIVCVPVCVENERLSYFQTLDMRNLSCPLVRSQIVIRPGWNFTCPGWRTCADPSVYASPPVSHKDWAKQLVIR